MATKVGQITRKEGMLYYTTKTGAVMETPRNMKGGKPGRKVRRTNKCTEEPASKKRDYKQQKATGEFKASR